MNFVVNSQFNKTTLPKAKNNSILHIDRRQCIGISIGSAFLFPSSSIAVTKAPPAGGIGSSKRDLAKMRNQRKAEMRERLAQVKEGEQKSESP
eukprot:TRINITY_DN1240_c0_g1_i1.p2 TRINITY_DN1240_c0_g1~~TRINITY_DN1240_c0_g1_i1.p2  ORF type:complete len:109 (-),score=4.56 TRINITY_DN1240_c0_g1_i1:348-626(-)